MHIFCQDTSLKGTPCSVTTFKMSDKILNLSKFDQDVHVQVQFYISRIVQGLLLVFLFFHFFSLFNSGMSVIFN